MTIQCVKYDDYDKQTETVNFPLETKSLPQLLGNSTSFSYYHEFDEVTVMCAVNTARSKHVHYFVKLVNNEPENLSITEFENKFSIFGEFIEDDI